MLTTINTRAMISDQRQFFQTGLTVDISFRREQLQRLQKAIETNQEAIITALNADLHKPKFEATILEISQLIKEIKYTLKHLKNWAKPQQINPILALLPAAAQIQPEPLGVVLIIAPWNYPFLLTIRPLIGAIAAGNCAILKPSELAPHTAQITQQIIAQTFPSKFVTVIQGDKTVTQDLLQNQFDHIFFTGGSKIGKIILEAAARHLTPVTLELGGKSPCIVEPDADLEYTAKHITWGKFINAGQTCTAPDYLLVHQSIKEPLLDLIGQQIKHFYGEKPEESPDYGRIINEDHWQRLSQLIEPEKVAIGGETKREDCYIAPTVLDGISWNDGIMKEEIFGPILPVLTYDNLAQVIKEINDRPKPLSLYLFSDDPKIHNLVTSQTSSGGVCINDAIVQMANPSLPFGGVGCSGMGAYHGRASFETFSHYKSVFKRYFVPELPLRYPPYNKEKLKFLQWLLKF